jgi:uncharacterized protein with NRDE domain
MCTIVVLNQVRADYPLVLATNRDEFYSRRSSGPGVVLEAPRSVGGLDLEAKGTWMGVTQTGLFVGLTNQRTFVMPDRTKRSRGEIVLEALRAGTPDAVREQLRSLDGRTYNGFNLMFGDAQSLWVAYGRETLREVRVERVPVGVHVLPNDTLECPDFAKVRRAKALVEPVARAEWPTLERTLEAMLGDVTQPDEAEVPEPPNSAWFDRKTLRRLAALCVRTEIYGTRSSTIVALTPGGVAHYRYADGPPDVTPFVDVTPLFA